MPKKTGSKEGGMKKYSWAVLALILIFPKAAWAESNLSIETSVSRSRVEIGGQVTMDLVVSNASGKIESPELGSIDGFTTYSQGHSQEISVINGRMSSRSVFSYVLVANAVGKKKIGPFHVQIDGKDYKVAPVEVEVVSGAPVSVGNTSVSTGPVAAPSPRSLPTSSVSDKDIFVQAWIDKDEVYVNEPVMLTYTLYTRLPATYKGFEKEPVTTGFWVEDFPPDKTIRRSEKFLQGSRYVVADVRKLALFPTEAGVFSLAPGTLAADVEIRQNEPFDDFFSNNIFGAQRAFSSGFSSQILAKNLVISPVQITAKTLPTDGRPNGFSGAVGNYLMEGSVDKNEVNAGDPVTYRIRIWGQGNLNTLEMPAFPKLEGLKVYDSSASTHISKDKLIVEGEKTTDTVIVPSGPGKFTVPPISFSYFDPADKTYKTMKTEAQVLTVTGTAQAYESDKTTTTAAGIEPSLKEDVSVLAKDIRFIKTAQAPRAVSGYHFYKNPFFWVLNALFFAGWVTLGILSAGKKTDSLAGLKDMKFRRSHALARQKLKDAKRMLREEKQDEFYAETSRAVYGYFGDKLGMSPPSVALPVIEARTGEELPPELFNDIRKLFDELSSGRFARSKKTKEDMQDLYGLADRVITFFERVKLK